MAQNNPDDALACITEAKLVGGHNYMLANAHGRGYDVEAMGARNNFEEVSSGTMTHTNRCLMSHNINVERPRLPQLRASSEHRLSQAETL